jgi:hypothetical protein
VDTFIVKDGLEFAAKLSADQRLIEEVKLHGGVCQFVTDLPQSLLAIHEAINYGADGGF